MQISYHVFPIFARKKYVYQNKRERVALPLRHTPYIRTQTQNDRTHIRYQKSSYTLQKITFSFALSKDSIKHNTFTKQEFPHDIASESPQGLLGDLSPPITLLLLEIKSFQCCPSILHSNPRSSLQSMCICKTMKTSNKIINNKIRK